MTVIAWDGKTLAADRQMTSGSTVQPTTKIHRHVDQLLGMTGNLSVGMEMLAWFRDGADPLKFPASNRKLDEGSSLIVISRDGSIQKYESTPYPFAISADVAAFGSGEESALVAMACGKSAQEAVEITCRFNTGCGLGVDTLTFND